MGEWVCSVGVCNCRFSVVLSMECWVRIASRSEENGEEVALPVNSGAKFHINKTSITILTI